MLRNYLATLLRNIAGNKVYAALNVLGLVIGLAGALLALLFVQHERSYDRFIPGHERINVVTGTVRGIPGDMTPSYFARWFETDFPGVELTRLMPQELSVRRGDLEAMEKTAWVDRNFFTMLPLPSVTGDLPTALLQPDAVVLTRRLATKYFGDEDPIGQTLEFSGGHPLRIAAVIEDLPVATHLVSEIYGSARNLEFGLVQLDQGPAGEGYNTQVMTYIASDPGKGLTAEELQNAMPDFARRNLGRLMERTGIEFLVHVTPLSEFHFLPNKISSLKPHGSPAALVAVGGAGLLVALIAIVNFACLTTARASRRAVEVGVRKMSGATARHLKLQLLGEAALYVLISTAVAVASVGLMLPSLDVSVAPGLGTQWITPFVAATIVGFVVVASLLAGFYPAFFLSALRPVSVLKGKAATHRHNGLRTALVVVQFTVLVILIMAVAVFDRQIAFSLRDGLRVDRDQMLVVYAPCRGPFVDEVRKLQGVSGAACSSRDPFNMFGFSGAKRRDGTEFNIGISGVGHGYFDVYGVKPVAGRVFAEDRDGARAEARNLPIVVLNETAVRALGFASPEEAVGRTFSTWENRDGPPSEIIGVVPDFIFDLRSIEIPPIMYVGVVNSRTPVLNIKIAGREVPEVLDDIDALWKQVGEVGPIRRKFVDQYLQDKYVDVIRQQHFISGLSLTAIVVACLGLFGLSAFAAVQRTKEIGIRKSMGATQSDILRLLLWQFAKPVLAANLIAWPVAHVLLQRWLEGFAYHIDLAPWMFLVASAVALLIALTTVIGHALLIARAHPVTALRYE